MVCDGVSIVRGARTAVIVSLEDFDSLRGRFAAKDAPHKHRSRLTRVPLPGLR